MLTVLTSAPKHRAWDSVRYDFATAPEADALAMFEAMLRHHDWTYAYADNLDEYSRGNRQYTSLREARKTLEARGLNVQALWEAYSGE